eukprot:gnl/TRDRNA2_/TRDRNA2_86089_c0_seq1.p1 gnl/TRDRNA2_/TRDRNA2_86089_c0~~gnl/TRDRNA2_/TRDRNA2_86089_c0_seq1.p1  ORF type:complete len:406 (-),score=47.94 gnl/TRDRNA2_/TRDRNA2_86089_c0_seq1:223-1440(-)
MSLKVTWQNTVCTTPAMSSQGGYSNNLSRMTSQQYVTDPYVFSYSGGRPSMSAPKASSTYKTQPSVVQSSGSVHGSKIHPTALPILGSQEQILPLREKFSQQHEECFGENDFYDVVWKSFLGSTPSSSTEYFGENDVARKILLGSCAPSVEYLGENVNTNDADGAVFLTGFGEFQGVKVNASWEAVRELTRCSPILKVGGCKYQLRAPAGPVSVTYRAVDEAAAAGQFGAAPGPQTIPQFKKPPLCLVIHAGVSMPGPIRLEAIARNEGYGKPDARGEMKPGGACVPYTLINGMRTAPCLGTRLNLSRVCAHVRKANCGVNVEVSHDAGLYLCEYIYYKSLHLAEKHAQEGSLAKSPAVLFIHVPPIGQPYTLPQLVEGLRAIVQACLEQVLVPPHLEDETRIQF